ncbi:2TM domain-containing protein [Candidatus Finniella inopinata]|nr:2TM domain-containing protein [Candidatus Finniella inopinata]
MEKTARKYVQDLKGLYTNVIIYAIVWALCILLWLSFGGSGFWPIWVLVGFGAATLLQGFAMGSSKQLEDFLPFLKPEWEEQQVKKLLKKPFAADMHQPKAAASAEPKEKPAKEVVKEVAKAEAPKAAPIKKTAPKKEPVLKKEAAPKKAPVKKKPTV